MCLRVRSVFQAFQQEIDLNTGKIGSVFSQGEALMEKSEPMDAAVIEEELDELQRYCREVFGRVDRYYRKLTRLPVRRRVISSYFILKQNIGSKRNKTLWDGSTSSQPVHS